jgi:hypothetical protein
LGGLGIVILRFRDGQLASRMNSTFLKMFLKRSWRMSGSRVYLKSA